MLGFPKALGAIGGGIAGAAKGLAGGGTGPMGNNARQLQFKQQDERNAQNKLNNGFMGGGMGNNAMSQIGNSIGGNWMQGMQPRMQFPTGMPQNGEQVASGGVTDYLNRPGMSQDPGMPSMRPHTNMPSWGSGPFGQMFDKFGPPSDMTKLPYQPQIVSGDSQMGDMSPWHMPQSPLGSNGPSEYQHLMNPLQNRLRSIGGMRL